MLKVKPQLFLLVLLSINVFGQKFELGKVTVEELQEKYCPADSSMPAAVLFKKSKIKYDSSIGQVVIETEVKLKIYKKEGYNYANISESYFTGNNESVRFSDVNTYNVLNGQIVKTKHKNENEYIEKVTKNFNIKKIALPDAKEGSIIEYRILRHSNNRYRLVNFYFQEEIPVNDIELTVEYPDRFYYNKSLTGFLSPKIVNEIYNSPNSKYKQNKTVYTLKNVTALKDEDYVNNINNYRSRIRYELASIKDSYGVPIDLSTDWETVAKSVYENEYFGDELKKTGYFEKDIDDLLSGVTAQKERINAIFTHVKSKMNWDKDYGYSCNEGVKKAYQDMKGNVAEINLMLTAMLRYAGLDANPILISTRSNGIALFPTIRAFNYVICGIELNNELVLLDATEKNTLPNILPIRDLNWFGRLIKKDGTSINVDLMPKSNSKDVINLMASINSQGEVSGKIREQYFDYNAFLFRQNNNGVSKDSYIEILEKKHQGLEIGEYDVQNNTDLSKPIVGNYDFTSNNSVEIIGDKMYLSPFLFFAKTENPFKQETREYPVDFVFPNQDKYTISLTIPDGYVVETLPQTKAVGLPDNLGSFKYSISNNGNQIQLQYTQDIIQAVIGSEYYEALKNFFKEIVNKQTEKIVIKKV